MSYILEIIHSVSVSVSCQCSYPYLCYINYDDESIPRSYAWVYTYTIENDEDDVEEVDDEDYNWKPMEIPDCVICISEFGSQ